MCVWRGAGSAGVNCQNSLPSERGFHFKGKEFVPSFHWEQTLSFYNGPILERVWFEGNQYGSKKNYLPGSEWRNIAKYYNVMECFKCHSINTNNKKQFHLS